MKIKFGNLSLLMSLIVLTTILSKFDTFFNNNKIFIAIVGITFIISIILLFFDVGQTLFTKKNFWKIDFKNIAFVLTINCLAFYIEKNVKQRLLGNDTFFITYINITSIFIIIVIIFEILSNIFDKEKEDNTNIRK